MQNILVIRLEAYPKYRIDSLETNEKKNTDNDKATR